MTDFQKWVAMLTALAISLSLLAVLTAALHLEHGTAAVPSHHISNPVAPGVHVWSNAPNHALGTWPVASLLAAVRNFLAPTPPDVTTMGLFTSPEEGPAIERQGNLRALAEETYSTDGSLRWGLRPTATAVTRALLALSTMGGQQGDGNDRLESSGPETQLRISLDEGMASHRRASANVEPCQTLFNIPKVRPTLPG